MSLGDLYNEIGWGVSVRSNVASIDEDTAQQFNPPTEEFDTPGGFKGAPGLHLPKKSALIARGKSFVSKHKRELRHTICVDWAYCEKRHHYDTATAVATIITPLVNPVLGVPAWIAALVTMVLVRSGLDKFCGCETTKRKARKRKKMIRK